MKFQNSATGEFIQITDAQNRKKPVLKIGNAMDEKTVASFTNEMAAYDFTSFLSEFLRKVGAEFE